MFANLLSGGLASPADCEGIYFYGGLADADGDRLARFTAGADAVIHGEIVSDHGDLFQRRGAVADERCILYRRADFAVFDHIGFGALEDEAAGSDVDLTAAKVDSPDALLDRFDNCLLYTSPSPRDRG